MAAHDGAMARKPAAIWARAKPERSLAPSGAAEIPVHGRAATGTRVTLLFTRHPLPQGVVGYPGGIDEAERAAESRLLLAGPRDPAQTQASRSAERHSQVSRGLQPGQASGRIRPSWHNGHHEVTVLGERPAVADPVHGVDDRRGRITGPDERGVQRVHRPVGGTVRLAVTSACPATWPPNTRCRQSLGLRPRKMSSLTAPGRAAPPGCPGPYSRCPLRLTVPPGRLLTAHPDGRAPGSPWPEAAEEPEAAWPAACCWTRPPARTGTAARGRG